MAEQEGKTIHSVAKAIRLLDLLTAAGQPASLTELYQKTGWPKSTIHGLLSTMRESGLIEQTPNGRYWLGIRLFEYGCAVSNSWDIGAIARPHMQNICTELGESVFLSVFDRAAVVTLPGRVPPHPHAHRAQGLHAPHAHHAGAVRPRAHPHPRAGLRRGKRRIQNWPSLGLRAHPRCDGRGTLRHRLRRHVPPGPVRRVPARHPPRLRRRRHHLPRHRLPRVRII